MNEEHGAKLIDRGGAADLHPCSHRLWRLLPSVVGGYAVELRSGI